MSWDNKLVDALDKNNGQFIIGSIGPAGLSVFNSPRVHESLLEATTEADRLAKMNPQKKFIVFRVEYVVNATPVVPQYNLVRNDAI